MKNPDEEEEREDQWKLVATVSLERLSNTSAQSPYLLTRQN